MASSADNSPNPPNGPNQPNPSNPSNPSNPPNGPIETYIFLGTQSRTHFFIHTQSSDQYKIDIPSQIYNVLIHEKFITDPADNVIIYHYNKKNKCELIIISHGTNPNNNKFSKENIESFFEVLVNADRNNSLVIVYDYVKGYYATYYIDMVLPISNELKFTNSSLINIVTVKPINE